MSSSHGDPEKYSVQTEQEFAVPTQKGAAAAEAAQSSKIWSPKLKWLLFLGLGLVAYVYSLDGSTTSFYLPFATSSFSEHSLLGAVDTFTAIVLAVGKPISAKLSDVLGRAQAYALAIIFYTLGYVLLASCKDINTYAAGAIFRYFGYTAIQILEQIVVADVTTLRWRALVSGLISAPFFVNAFVGAIIAARITEHSTWRWGYGMFAIIIPAVACPIVLVLGYSQAKAYKLGLVHSTNPYEDTQVKAVEEKAGTWAARVFAFLEQLDAGGLLLFTAGWACVLLPLTLVNGTSLTWTTPKMLALLIVGIVILIAFTAYEFKFAKYPIMPWRFVANPTVCACALIGFFDFVSFYLQYDYQYSFVYIVKYNWTLTNQNYYADTQTVALTLFGIIGAIWVGYTRRYKWLLVVGMFIRLLGVGLMIHSKGANGSTAELVIVNVIQGMGGGIASMATELAAQASVPHQDVATVTAFILLITELGGSIGAAIAAAMWRHEMPNSLQSHLSGVANSTVVEEIYGNIVLAATYPPDSPVREGVISAYEYVMKNILIVATAVAVIPALLAFIPKNFRLDDVHNVVENKGLDGEVVETEEWESQNHQADYR